jgi:large subunit ribosomal protein LX
VSAKVFRVKGEIMKKHFFEPLTFDKLVSATKKDHAVEKVYSEMGSRHRAKRHQISIDSVEEEQPEG